MDYIVCYYCSMDIEPDYKYKYLENSNYGDACLYADRKSGQISIEKYGDLIIEEAESYISKDKKYQIDVLAEMCDSILLNDYIGYEVGRVLDLPKNITKDDFIKDPVMFCNLYCEQETK